MKQFRIAGAAVAVAALALPAVASGHGSVFQITAKTVTDPANPPANQAGLADQVQYVVSNHGFTYGAARVEHTGRHSGHAQLQGRPRARTGTSRGGTPTRPRVSGSAWRPTPASSRTPPASAQRRPHSARPPAAILGWQGADPFYNYVPFQAASAGLEDDPASWLAVIEAETAVDRSQLTNATDAAAACTSIGGTYRAADATVTAATSLASGTIAAEKAPLQSQVAQLTQAKAAADAAKAAADAAKAAADRARANALTQLAAANAALAGSRSDAQKYLLASAPVELDVFGSTKASTVARQGATISVTGPALRPATVQLQVSSRKAKAMGLKSRVLARKVTTIGAGGSTVVVVKPATKVAKALRRLKGSLRVTVSGSSTSRDTATTRFTR